MDTSLQRVFGPTRYSSAVFRHRREVSFEWRSQVTPTSRQRSHTEFTPTTIIRRLRATLKAAAESIGFSSALIVEKRSIFSVVDWKALQILPYAP